MTKQASKILQEALGLSASDRAQLAARLLTSLDESEDDVQKAWAAELLRRDADPADCDSEEDWEAVLVRIEKDVLKR